MIINTVTGEAYDGDRGIAFVPATTNHVFVEWKPRKEGGGFVAVHEVASPTVAQAKNESQEFGKYSIKGNDLIETFYVFGVGMDTDGNMFQAVLAFTSTKIKKYKAWMTRAKTIQLQIDANRRIPAPLFAHRYLLRTVGEKNNNGSFYNWEVTFDGPDAASARLMPKSDLFQAAVAVKTAIESGQAKAAHASQDSGSAPSSDGSSKPVF
jgi:hypothetical protein